MEEALARGVQIFLALAGAYLVALWFALIVWAYRDIGSRSQSVVTQVAATLLVVLFSIPGAFLYLLLRPRTTLDESFQRSLEEEYLLQDLEELPVCHSCNRAVADDYVLCPHCQATLRHACGACGKLVNVRWPICPYCGSSQSEGAVAIRERVEPPAERFLERSQRTFRQLTGTSIREIAYREPAIAMAHEPELTTGEPEPPPVAAEASSAEEQTPIRLFDRKKTRARKQATQIESALQGVGGGDEAEADAASEIVEETAVIAEFVANGNDPPAVSQSEAEAPVDQLPKSNGKSKRTQVDEEQTAPTASNR